MIIINDNICRKLFVAALIGITLFVPSCKHKEVEVIEAIPPKKSDISKSEDSRKKIIKNYKANPNFKNNILLQDTTPHEKAVDTQSFIPIIANLLHIDSIVSLPKDSTQVKVEVIDTITSEKPVVIDNNISNDTMFIGYNIDTMMHILGVSKSKNSSKQPLILTKKKKKINSENNVLQIAPLVGTDVGGGVPYGHIPKDFRPYPQLHISLGLWLNYIITKHWQIGITGTYKTVSLAADARMKNEYFSAVLPGSDQITKVYYTGIARQSMSFTMLEFPLVVKYGFGKKGKYRIVGGGYGAWIIDKSFLVVAKTGYQGSAPNKADVNIIKTPISLDFSDALRNWEAGLVLGYEQAITKRLNVDFMVYGGFNDIVIPAKKFLTYSMFPMRLGLHVSYSLFEFAPNQENKFRFVYK